MMLKSNTWYKLFLIFKDVPFVFFQILFLLSIWLLIFFLIKKNNGDKYLIKLKIIFTFVFLSTIILILFLYFNSFNLGIVQQKKLALYVGPDKTYPIKTELDFNNEVIIERKKISNEWWYIYYDSKKGWVPSQGIKIIK